MVDWNIEGIADEIIKEMKQENADIGDADYYVRRIAYWSVFSRAPEDATLVAAQVIKLVLKKFDAEQNE